MDNKLESKTLHIPSSIKCLPQSWTWRRLDNICLAIVDCPHSTPKIISDGPLMARTQDILSGTFRAENAAHVSEATYQERIKRAEPIEGDLLYSREGTYFGIAAEVPSNVRVCLGQRMVLLRPDPTQIYFRFLRYWLNSSIIASHIYGQRDGSVAERLNLSTIRDLPIPLPSLSEQRAIAHILGPLDDKINLNQRMNATLESIAQALFKSWFVDFDPVKAKAEGRKPEGMDDATAALFPSAFAESALGPIPEGWMIETLGEMIEIYDSKRIPLSSGQRSKRQGPYPYYGATSIMDYVDNYLFDGVYVLIGEDGSVQREDETPFVQYVWGKFWVNNHAHVLQGKSISNEHLKLFLENLNITPYITGAVQLKLNQANLKRVPFINPGTHVAEAFKIAVINYYLKERKNIEQILVLSEIRDALLPRLISGELQVDEITEIMKALAS